MRIDVIKYVIYLVVMVPLKQARNQKGLSQRRLAQLAGVAYKTVQLIESGLHDPKLSTLKNLAKALGYPTQGLTHHLTNFFRLPSDCIYFVGERIVEEGQKSWTVWLFNFVDAFRNKGERKYIDTPPPLETPQKIKALLAATVESLCDEKNLEYPLWCKNVPSLKEPWFVSGVENLKATALVESPIHFRKRIIFVLENFLDRR